MKDVRMRGVRMRGEERMVGGESVLHKSLKLHRLGKKLHLQDKGSCSFQSLPLCRQ